MLNRIKTITVIYPSVTVLALALLFLLSARAEAAGTCRVPSQYSTIQAAVDDPACSDVDVAAGTYYENVVINRDVNIAGDSRGDTIVDGGGDGSVFLIEPPVSISLSRLIIQNGNANGQPNSGGGVANVEGNVTISKSIIRDNTAHVFGGGIWNARGTLAVSDTTISGNDADWAGGIAAGGQMTVRHSLISNNVATYSVGGLLITNHATGEVAHSVIRDNRARWGAGLMNSDGATLRVFKTHITRNEADEWGGGIANGFSATLTLKHSEVLENEAGDLGGDLFNVMNSTAIIEHSAVGDIYNDDSSTIVR